MKKRTGFILSTLVAGLLSLSAVSSVAFAGDEDKLKELERAMNTPAEGSIVKKPRTRAIVFDNEPTAKAIVFDNEPAQATPPASQPSVANCSSLPSDVKATAVDFSIQFKVGSADIAPASEDVLRQIAKILALSPDRCVLVEGHTDASGNADKNLSLSRDRAGSVAKFITEKAGIDRNRLVPIGKGSSDPLKNLNPRDSKNRRVVFKVVG